MGTRQRFAIAVDPEAGDAYVTAFRTAQYRSAVEPGSSLQNGAKASNLQIVSTRWKPDLLFYQVLPLHSHNAGRLVKPVGQ